MQRSSGQGSQCVILNDLLNVLQVTAPGPGVGCQQYAGATRSVKVGTLYNPIRVVSIFFSIFSIAPIYYSSFPFIFHGQETKAALA